MMITLERASEIDIATLLRTEKKLAGMKTYSPILDVDGWKEELKKCVVYLIKKDGVVVGNTSYERQNGAVYLSGLAIEPEFQHQGIGREVLQRILEEVKDTSRIWLVTHPDNAASLRLYQSLGFVVESRKENYFGDGAPRLVLGLQKK